MVIAGLGGGAAEHTAKLPMLHLALAAEEEGDATAEAEELAAAQAEAAAVVHTARLAQARTSRASLSPGGGGGGGAAIDPSLDAGADIDSRDLLFQMTALHLAANQGRAHSVDLLVAARGAALHLQDPDGQTALFILLAARYSSTDAAM